MSETQDELRQRILNYLKQSDAKRASLTAISKAVGTAWTKEELWAKILHMSQDEKPASIGTQKVTSGLSVFLVETEENPPEPEATPVPLETARISYSDLDAHLEMARATTITATAAAGIQPVRLRNPPDVVRNVAALTYQRGANIVSQIPGADLVVAIGDECPPEETAVDCLPGYLTIKIEPPDGQTLEVNGVQKASCIITVPEKRSAFISRSAINSQPFQPSIVTIEGTRLELVLAGLWVSAERRPYFSWLDSLMIPLFRPVDIVWNGDGPPQSIIEGPRKLGLVVPATRVPSWARDAARTMVRDANLVLAEGEKAAVIFSLTLREKDRVAILPV